MVGDVGVLDAVGWFERPAAGWDGVDAPLVCADDVDVTADVPVVPTASSSPAEGRRTSAIVPS